MGKAKSIVLAMAAGLLLTAIPLSAATPAANKTNKAWAQAGDYFGENRNGDSR